MKKSLLTIIFGFLVVFLSAQETSSGNCYYNDYLIWDDLGYPDVHGDCGNSDLFNTGEYLTIEMWVRAYSFGENRKLCGKLPPELQPGYVMGFQNLNVYTEVMNPATFSVVYPGTGPLPQDSAWVHLSVTYAYNGQLKEYINGVLQGTSDIFPQNPIPANDAPFIIGRAPWDYAFVYYGDIDEIRVWSSERTEAEINSYKHKQLNGSEPGLVAYYDFNNNQDSVFFDQSPNGNNGVIKKYDQPCFWWETSYAPVGDSMMYAMNDVQAAWYGKRNSQFNYIDTLNGLTIIADINEKEFRKYVVAGHNDSTGTTTENIPAVAPADFKMLKTIWYVNKGGSFTSTLKFDLKENAAPGDTLTLFQPDSLYTLLKWDEILGEFYPLHSADLAYFDSEYYYVYFNNVQLSDGYYTLGQGSEKLADPAGVAEISRELLVEMYPNPADELITVKNANGFELSIIDLSGRTVMNKKIDSLIENTDISHLKSGFYLVRLTDKTNETIKKLIIK